MDPLCLEASDNPDNQPVTGATKTGGGWQEGIDEATTRPRRWATTNDESVRRMVMAVTKRARMARAMVTAMRVPVDEEGEGGTGHGVGDERAAKRAMATAARAMATRVAGERRRGGRWQQKANNNQPVTGLTKVGGGWRESVDKATTRPRRWATTNDESVRRMTMAATKRARVDRAMVTEMRVVGNK